MVDGKGYIGLDDLPKYASRLSPMNTMATPTHCRGNMGLPNSKTEASMVKNFRVVVMIEVVKGPKLVTVRNIKFCENNNNASLASTMLALHWEVGHCIYSLPAL